MKKIVLIGPESTGKTSLCEQLAQHFNAEWIPEYARTYVENLSRKYNYADVENIAKMQQMQFREKEIGDGIVFFDTDLIITKVWFSECYAKVPEWLDAAIKDQNVSLYLLCKPDLDWKYDAVRENAHNRQYLYDCYKKEVERLAVPWVEIEGFGNVRIENAINAVKKVC